MAGLSLLRNTAELESYKSAVSFEFGVDPTVAFWGKPPETYPCLVATLLRAPNHFCNCYVYPFDASRLLAVTPEALKPLAHSTRPSFEEQQSKYNDEMAAGQLTFYFYGVETGLFKPEQWRETYMRHLQLIEQAKAAKLEEFALSQGGQEILERLGYIKQHGND